MELQEQLGSISHLANTNFFTSLLYLGVTSFYYRTFPSNTLGSIVNEDLTMSPPPEINHAKWLSLVLVPRSLSLVDS